MSEDVLKKAFSEEMKKIMAERTLTESHIKNKTGISQSAINRIKNGEVCPSLYQAYLIAKTLCVPLKQLMTPPENTASFKKKNYIPVIKGGLSNHIETDNLIGFLETNKNDNKELVGFKVDSQFQCKLLETKSVVIADISKKSPENGDTILVMHNNSYSLGTTIGNLFKPIDNLSKGLNIDAVIYIGTVVSIENKFVKEASMVEKFKEKFTTEILNTLKTLSLKTVAI